jgi:hypothetical protein
MDTPTMSDNTKIFLWVLGLGGAGFVVWRGLRKWKERRYVVATGAKVLPSGAATFRVIATGIWDDQALAWKGEPHEYVIEYTLTETGGITQAGPYRRYDQVRDELGDALPAA